MINEKRLRRAASVLGVAVVTVIVLIALVVALDLTTLRVLAVFALMVAVAGIPTAYALGLSHAVAHSSGVDRGVSVRVGATKPRARRSSVDDIAPEVIQTSDLILIDESEN